jgi:hypothetical protein
MDSPGITVRTSRTRSATDERATAEVGDETGRIYAVSTSTLTLTGAAGRSAGLARHRRPLVWQQVKTPAERIEQADDLTVGTWSDAAVFHG